MGVGNTKTSLRHFGLYLYLYHSLYLYLYYRLYYSLYLFLHYRLHYSIYLYLYCITPLAWVEIQCFALTAYLLTCSHAYMFTCLYACTLHYGTAAIPQKQGIAAILQCFALTSCMRTCRCAIRLYAEMLILLYCFRTDMLTREHVFLSAYANTLTGGHCNTHPCITSCIHFLYVSYTCLHAWFYN